MGDPQMVGLFHGTYPKMDENWGYPYDLGNLHIFIEFYR